MQIVMMKIDISSEDDENIPVLRRSESLKER